MPEEQNTQQQQGLIDVTTREAREALSEKDKERFREAKTTAYSKAQTKVREDHLDEFNATQQRLLAKDGFNWRPELTEKEKAQLEFERLLEANPEFAALVQKNQEAEDAEAVEDEAGEDVTVPDDPTYPDPDRARA